ncbi:uncharacterized protein LOC100570263 [Acyrthosiphon pisum]|uniref:THAP-type domain-containing protein n=1 Tax=Acyrthosiphon pisum TaxID=7029 RepID=A0A8R2AC87_ACYPI|nr:uncharacterized protein LOC100570263 [Acyrthosiphon pisum]|eukprot:XP_003245120.2 PREDICTED: uncharacterized protein LOC100570263 isoform X2 [Acyrthosiphon pisum]
MPKCLVCENSSASTNRRDITYHSFPRNEYLRREWLNVYGIDHCNDTDRICSDHFLEENYRTGRKKYLKKDTIPQGYDKNCLPSNCTQSNDVVMSNNEFLPTELNRLSYTTRSYVDETSTNEFLPRDDNHLRKVQSYENMTRLQTEPFDRQMPTFIANDNIRTVIESGSAPVLTTTTTTKYKPGATSTLKMPDKLSSNTVINPELIDNQITFLKHISPANKLNSSVLPEIKTPVISECYSLAGKADIHDSNPDKSTNTSQYIIIDDDDTENFRVKDHRFIYNISRIIVLPSALWRIVYDCVQNTTSFYQRDSSYKTVKKISFYNSLLPKIQIYGINYKYNKPIKSKKQLQSLLEKVDSIKKCSGVDGFTTTKR